MDKDLYESGLFGHGLVPINTSSAVERYNEALRDLGVAPTNLSSFAIDGIGWSPHIAAERGTKTYLAHGDANQIGIVATPDQYRKPVHFPANSFDRRLMRVFFERYMREIGDITTSTCVRLDLEQALTAYRSPRDLVGVNVVTIRASGGDLVASVKQQCALEAEFMAKGTSWFDPILRQRIITSAKTYGDVRRRRADIQDLPFALIENFWSRAFGGAFVLRLGGDSILVLEDDTLLPKSQPREGDRFITFSLADAKKLVSLLVDEDLLEIDWQWLREHPEELEHLWDCFVADIVCQAEPDCAFELLGSGKRKSILHSSRDTIPEVFYELEEVMRDLSYKKRKDPPPHISDELALLLLRPKSKEEIGANYQEVLWMLLMRLQGSPLDVFALYSADKEHFFKVYEGWTPAKKRWAIAHVKERYVPQMNQP